VNVERELPRLFDPTPVTEPLRPGIRQANPRAGVIDLALGHPDPGLLPVEGLKHAAIRVMETYGADALAYGAPAGPSPLIAWICERLGDVDARAPTPDCVVVSAGNSHALDQLVTLLTLPGDVVLVEAPTYHLAVRIFQDHPVRIVAVPTDADGLDVDSLRTTLARERRDGNVVRMLYTIPTFHNPTGRCLAYTRRLELVDLADLERLLIVEDDAYRELAYGGVAPASLWSLAPPGTVIRLGSFSKSLAPGLRAGFITADPILARRITTSGVLDSGGGISHFASLVIAEYAAAGDYARHVETLRHAYTGRRDTLLAALSRFLGGRATWIRPLGGYFAWITLDGDIDTARALPAVLAQGAEYVPGNAFYLDLGQGASSFRLAFSHCSPDELTEAVSRIARALAASHQAAPGQH
jgi:2-aminoadipate transaminase